MRKNTFIKLIAAAAILFLEAAFLTGCRKDDEKKVLKIGTLASQIQPALASKLGYFDELGLNVEIFTFTGGPAEVEAFTSGDLDIVFIGDLPFINGVNNGVDLQVIGFYQTATKDCRLGVSKESGIESFADLKGKKIAVPAGSNAQPILYEMLDSGNVSTDDVEIVNLSAADGANALLTKDVDAAITWDPFLSRAVSQGSVIDFADTSSFRPLVCPIATSSKNIGNRGDEIRKALKAFHKAGKYAKENPDRSAALIAEFFNAKSPEAYLISIANKDLDIRITDEKIEALQKGADKSNQYGLTKSTFDVRKNTFRDFSLD